MQMPRNLALHLLCVLLARADINLLHTCNGMRCSINAHQAVLVCLLLEGKSNSETCPREQHRTGLLMQVCSNAEANLERQSTAS